MLKKLIDKILAPFSNEDTASRDCLHDYTTGNRVQGHDIAINITGDGGHARAVIWGDEIVEGDIVAFDHDENILYHFVVDIVDRLEENVYCIEMHRFELEAE